VKKRIYAMMDTSKKRFSPVLFLVVLVVTMCGTTAFALSPATSPTPNNRSEQPPNQTMVGHSPTNLNWDEHGKKLPFVYEGGEMSIPLD